MNIKWEGTFTQFDQEYEVEFENMMLDLNGNVSGEGSDAIGQFKITGTQSPNGDLKFLKQYLGMHGVHYQGFNDNGLVTGTWEIPGNCDGTFTIYVKVPRWEGWYEHANEKVEMNLNLAVSSEGVWGSGNDEIGHFVIKGYCDPNQSCVTFVKQYLGKHKVHYNGC